MKKGILLMLVVFFMAFSAYAQSEIVVKRASSSIYSGFREQIFIDGQNRLNLANGAEARITVPDGEHVILAKLSSLTSNEVRFTARSDSITFIVTPHSSQQLVIETVSSTTEASLTGYDRSRTFNFPVRPTTLMQHPSAKSWKRVLSLPGS